MGLIEQRELVRSYLLRSADVKWLVAESCSDEIVDGAEMIVGALRAGGKVLLCGNGGSAADAQHIAAEFTSGLAPRLQRPAYAAIALTTDSSFLTAHANDFGFENVFRRHVEALGREGDVLIAISTSGNSVNVLSAVEACRSRGIRTIGLTGGQGGRLRDLADLAIVVPSSDTQHIQEAHIAIGHIIAELAASALADARPATNGVAHVAVGER